MPNIYADIILPLAVKGRFTYLVPENLVGLVNPGSIVLVPFASKKLYAGAVVDVHNNKPDFENIKPIRELLPTIPALNGKQLKLWHWISKYYMCSEGEVMKAAIPSAFMPESDKSGEYEERYKPKEEQYVEVDPEMTGERLSELLDKLSVKAPKQASLLAKFLDMAGYADGVGDRPVKKSVLLATSDSAQTLLNTLVKKKILKLRAETVSRLNDGNSVTIAPSPLSVAQQKALEGIKSGFAQKDVVLLHGVTSSGKTEIYIHLIADEIKKGKQVLYMLPEIALTSQIINRLRTFFGSSVGVYHSRFNNAERVEIWNKTVGSSGEPGYGLILGVRSSIFLPFDNLGLIIVDEEHDGSYKQQDPSPRYNARDTAIILAGMHKAKTLLGSASPSIESFYNAMNGKYALVELKERFGAIKLPDIILANTREAYRKKLMVSHFTPELLTAVDDALSKGEQSILFQNRRGFAPYVECPECGWVPTCERCSVRMTYHKGINKLVCHYCGETVNIPSNCGSCGSLGLNTKGFGTEKIEEEVKIIFPGAKVGRMDQDTTRGKNSFNKIIGAFEDGKIDILTGTQMISKGLDFENLTVVGILNADNMLNYPDFRAHERGYQLIEQVSGRAGRRKKQGTVVIQTADPKNRVIRLLLNHDYFKMYQSELDDRTTFNYPPLCRMIRINLKHKEVGALNRLADELAGELKLRFKERVLGPEFPLVSRIQLWYIKTIIVKLEADSGLSRSKETIGNLLAVIEKSSGASSLRISVDVDPY